jgi:hypothetical protein
MPPIPADSAALSQVRGLRQGAPAVLLGIVGGTLVTPATRDQVGWGQHWQGQGARAWAMARAARYRDRDSGVTVSDRPGRPSVARARAAEEGQVRDNEARFGHAQEAPQGAPA